MIFTAARDTFNIVSKLKEKQIIPHQYMKNTIVFETNEKLANVKSWMDDLHASINKRGNLQIYQVDEFTGYSDTILDTKFQNHFGPKKTEEL